MDLPRNTCVLPVCIHSEFESCHLYETKSAGRRPYWLGATLVTSSCISSATWQPTMCRPTPLQSLKVYVLKSFTSVWPEPQIPDNPYSVFVSIRPVKPWMLPCHPPAW